jgi:hypothetical protein
VLVEAEFSNYSQGINLAGEFDTSDCFGSVDVIGKQGVKWCRSRMIASASVLSPSQPLRCTARDLTVHQQPKNTAVNAPLSYCALLTHVVVISVTDNCLLNLVGFARQSCHLKGQDLLHLYGNNIRQRLYNFQLAMLCDADSRKRQTRFIAECHKNVTN